MADLTNRSIRQRLRQMSHCPVHDKSRIVLSGVVLWLPSYEQLLRDIPGLDEDCYGHPVVVLSPEMDQGQVTVLLVMPSLPNAMKTEDMLISSLQLTSFDQMDLEDRFRDNAKMQKNYLPIFPSSPHPDNQKLLRLENESLTLRKNSYVNTRTSYEVDIEFLHPYEHRGPDYVLSENSYHELIEYCGFQTSSPYTEPPWTPDSAQEDPRPDPSPAAPHLQPPQAEEHSIAGGIQGEPSETAQNRT
ncbi:hypothetical protein PG990_013426 [Apiospora arundinis]